jgi:hypothetical protein
VTDQQTSLAEPSSTATTRPPLRRRASWLAVLAGTIVTAPLIALPLGADERFHPYQYGSKIIEDPSLAVTGPVSFSFGNIAKIGNFRPLGRIVEHVNYFVDELVGRVFELPMNLVLGVVRILSVILLTVCVQLLLRRVLPSSANGPFVVAAKAPTLLVASGYGSPMVIFSGLYLRAQPSRSLRRFRFFRLLEVADGSGSCSSELLPRPSVSSCSCSRRWEPPRRWQGCFAMGCRAGDG